MGFNTITSRHCSIIVNQQHTVLLIGSSNWAKRKAQMEQCFHSPQRLMGSLCAMMLPKRATEVPVYFLVLHMTCLANAGQQILTKKFVAFVPFSLQRGDVITTHSIQFGKFAQSWQFHRKNLLSKKCRADQGCSVVLLISGTIGRQRKGWHVFSSLPACSQNSLSWTYSLLDDTRWYLVVFLLLFCPCAHD